MRFSQQKLAGTYLVTPERISDERGFFARTYCQQELANLGIDPAVAQCSVSNNPTKGTLRGMHWQAEPHGETKLVRCTAGAIFDVLVDLRPDSSSYLQWVAEELTAENHLALLVPPGVAHGFVTLEPASEVFYQISADYHPESARGARWDDPIFAIEWPVKPALISERDATYPDVQPEA